eukprot:SAG25_NODE_188_length_12354_cov_23.716116_12_plen_93_part_00
MGITEIQLFVLLQDTVSHIRTGKHITGNYHHCKQEVLNAFGYDKRTPSIKLLVCIGHVYLSVLEDQKTFSNYIRKFDLIDAYNNELDRIAQD